MIYIHKTCLIKFFELNKKLKVSKKEIFLYTPSHHKHKSILKLLKVVVVNELKCIKLNRCENHLISLKFTSGNVTIN